MFTFGQDDLGNIFKSNFIFKIDWFIYLNFITAIQKLQNIDTCFQ